MIFNGTITIRRRSTGDHRTFRIKTYKQGPLEGKRVVSLLSGPDNENHYQGFGFVSEDGTKINVWRKHRGQDGHCSAYDWYAIYIEQLTGGSPEWLQQFDIQAEKRCAVCNRKLTNPESLLTGVGPECGNRGKNSKIKDLQPGPQET